MPVAVGDPPRSIVHIVGDRECVSRASKDSGLGAAGTFRWDNGQFHFELFRSKVVCLEAVD